MNHLNHPIVLLGLLASAACGPRERPTSAAIPVPPVGPTATALAAPTAPSASASEPGDEACVCPWIEQGGGLRIPNGWVRHLVGVEAAWRAWPRLGRAWVDCRGREEGGWSCVYNVDGAELNPEQDLKGVVDTAIEAVRPLGLKADDGPPHYKRLARGDDVILMLLGGASQLVIRGDGSVGEGFVDWLRTCGGTSELVEELPWDALTQWGMSSDDDVQQWDFTFDRIVAEPWLEDSGWNVEEAGERQVHISRPLEPLAGAPRCHR